MQRSKTSRIQNIVVGKRDVDPSLPSHVPGVHEGNWPGSHRLSPGVLEKDDSMTAKPTRSTGINPERRLPIDPRMPRLTPA